MAKLFVILILVMFIVNVQKISGQYEYQFFRLVMIWGPSYCRMNPCRREPPAPKFTLHGLWPDNYTRNLYNCRGRSYIPLWDQQSINARDDYWFDYFLRNPPWARGNWRVEQRFWAQEWSRHGTCSKKVFNQQAYFNLAEKLMFAHDLTSILFNPTHPIPLPWPRVSDVRSAISSSIGVTPQLRCHYYKNSKILVEVALCYDVLGKQVINCPRPGILYCGRRSSIIYVPENFK